MKTETLKNCPVCEKSDWHDLDYLRDHNYWYNIEYVYNEPIGFKICKNCGYVTYDLRNQEEVNIQYQKERPVVKAGNHITCNRKDLYHNMFLGDFLKDKNKDNFSIIDIGSAQGTFLYLMKNKGFKKIYGVEINDSFRDFGKNEYGLQIEDKIENIKEKDKKFDFISYYHVLEHIQDPREEIEKMKGYLKKDGYFYLSVPLWFDLLEESLGMPCVDFENYYHLNHCNVFSYISFRNFLKSLGLKVIKEDNLLYGYTVLCQLGDDEWQFKKENYEDIELILNKQKKVIELINLPPKQRNYDDIIKIYPKYPDIYIFKATDLKNAKDINTSKRVLEEAILLMPNNYRLKIQLAILLLQWDEQNPKEELRMSNNLYRAEEILNECMKMRGETEEILYFKGIIEGKYKQNYLEAVKYLKKALAINPLRFAEIWDTIGYFHKSKGISERGK